MKTSNNFDALSRDQMRMVIAGDMLAPKTCTSCNANGTSYYCHYSSINNSDTCTCSVSGSDGTGCKVVTQN